MSHAHTHAHHPTVVPVPGPPVVIPASHHRTPPPPASGHDHQWVLSAVFSVNPEHINECVAAWMNGGTPPGLPMEYETLLNVIGPVCLKCNQPLNPKTSMMPCPVVLIPVIGVANNRR